MQLATAIYRLTQSFPREEMYGLVSQLRRAAVSIPSNIAEGHGRSSAGEYRQFLWIARGSNFELQTQLLLALRASFISQADCASISELIREVERMIESLIRKVEASKPTPDSP